MHGLRERAFLEEGSNPQVGQRANKQSGRHMLATRQHLMANYVQACSRWQEFTWRLYYTSKHKLSLSVITIYNVSILVFARGHRLPTILTQICIHLHAMLLYLCYLRTVSNYILHHKTHARILHACLHNSHLQYTASCCLTINGQFSFHLQHKHYT